MDSSAGDVGGGEEARELLDEGVDGVEIGGVGGEEGLTDGGVF